MKHDQKIMGRQVSPLASGCLECCRHTHVRSPWLRLKIAGQGPRPGSLEETIRQEAKRGWHLVCSKIPESGHQTAGVNVCCQNTHLQINGKESDIYFERIAKSDFGKRHLSSFAMSTCSIEAIPRSWLPARRGRSFSTADHS